MITNDQELFDEISRLIRMHSQINYAGDMVINSDSVAQMIMMLLESRKEPDACEQFRSIVTQVELGGAVTHKLTVRMLKQVPLSQLYAKGFRNWDGLMVLLPLWALAHMQEGECLECIDGSLTVVGTDAIDLDTRGGCVAYGVPRSDIARKENT